MDFQQAGELRVQRGGLFQSFLLAVECEMWGWPLALGYRRVPQSGYCKKWIMWQKIQAVSEENGPVFQDGAAAAAKRSRLIPDL